MDRSRSRVRPAVVLAVMILAAAMVVVFAGTSAAAPKKKTATILTFYGDTGPPPAKICFNVPGASCFQMTPFGPDAFADGDTVCSLPAPLTYQGALGPQGDLLFNPCFSAGTIGTTWATWSHGYTGRVYENLDSDFATLTMPSRTGAFYLYLEPNSFDTFLVTVTGRNQFNQPQSASVFITGDSGATLVGAAMPFGGVIKNISIDCGSGIDSCGGFAVGELAIAGPKMTKVT